MKRTLVAIGLVMLISSCADDFGHKVVGDKLTVYFVDEADEQKATDLAMYMKKRSLLTGEQQDLQLVTEMDQLYVKLIANNPEEAKKTPLSERMILLEFQKELKDSVFNTPVSLLICDRDFNPIYDPNK